MTKREASQTSIYRKRVWRKRFGLIGFTIVLLVLGIAVAQQRLISYAVEKVLVLTAPELGLRFVEAKISGHLGAPIILENIRLGPPLDAPVESQTAITIRRAEVAFRSLLDILNDRSRFIARMKIDGAFLLLDYRPESLPPFKPLRSLTPQQQQRVSDLLKRFMPLSVEIAHTEVDILASKQRYHLAGLKMHFLENKLGTIYIHNGFFQAGLFQQAINNVEGRTAWKDGTLFISGLPLAQHFEIHNFVVNLVRPGGVALSLEGAAYGGWVSATAAFGERRGMPTVDTTLWAQQIPLRPLALDLNQQKIQTGILQDVRFTFRGIPTEALDGDWILRLTVNDIAYLDHTIEKFEIGATINNHLLTLSTVELIQGQNVIKGAGNIRLNTPFDWQKTDLFLQIDAVANDLGNLTNFIDTHATSLQGSAQLKADIKNDKGQLQGAIRASGENLVFNGVSLGDFAFITLLNGSEAKIERCELKQAKDFLNAIGTVNLQQPYYYDASFSAQIADLAHYNPLFSQLSNLSGSLACHWQGDGNLKSHSGAFNLALQNFCDPPVLPKVINVSINGTYSPENLYLAHLQLNQNALTFTGNLSIGENGIYANNLFLKSRRLEVLSGEIYLPWDPRPLLTGKTWTEGLKENKELYISLRGNKLSLSDVASVFGQQFPIDAESQLEIEASGSLLAPKILGAIEFRNLHMVNAASTILSNASVHLSANEGRAAIKGQLAVTRKAPITLDAEFPIGAYQAEDGQLHFFNPVQHLTASLSLPQTDLSQFHSLAPDAKTLQGDVAGDIKINLSKTELALEGFLKIQNGAFALNRFFPDLSMFDLSLTFDKNRLHIDNCTGAVGAGPFTLSGEVSYSNPRNPEFDLALKGQKILLVRNSDIRLRSDIQLQFQGNAEQGSVTGEVYLEQGRIYKRLEITPLLVGNGALNPEAPLLLPDLKGYIPPPFANWTLDIHISNASPFLIIGNIASGSIHPSVKIIGYLKDPRPTGEIVLNNIRAYLPSTVMNIPNGHIYLREENPRNPIIDIKGEAEVAPYLIQLYAYGPLNERNLILRSDPPLPQETILRILTTGFTPGTTAESSFGEAAAGQGTLLLLRTFARQFETEGVDLDSFFNRFQMQVMPPAISGQTSILRGNIRLADGWHLIAERDSYGFLNGGISYILRFK